MKTFLLILLTFLCSCAKYPETVPVLYIDYNYNTGMRKTYYWFEGELFDGNEPFAGFVSIKRFIGTGYGEENYNWYKGFIDDRNFYGVDFPEGYGAYILTGRGNGHQGIEVSPQWIPQIDKVINTLSEKK